MIGRFGRFGILTGKLIDPLSEKIDKIMKINENECNTIGFYYINESEDYKVFLFDIHDAHPIIWTFPYYTMAKILSSRFINKMTCYPIDDKHHNTNFQLVSNTQNGNLEENFIYLVTGLTIFHQKKRNYNSLLLKIVGNNEKLGYNLINKILCSLNKTSYDNISYINGIMKCSLIKNSVSFNAKTFISNIDDNNIVILINKEIRRLTNSFVKLLNNHKSFAASITVDLSLFSLELNENKSSKSNNDDQIIIESLIMKNLGRYLNQIINSETKSEQGLAIKNTIITYNNLISDANLPSIEISDKINILLKPDIIFPHSSNFDIISTISNNISSENKSDLNELSDMQLFDILIYIDSLRDTSGLMDNRFSSVQNEITRELSLRHRKG